MLAAGAIDWTLGRFVEGIEKYSYSVERDPRLLDDKYLQVRACACAAVDQSIQGDRPTTWLFTHLPPPPPSLRPLPSRMETQRERHWPPAVLQMVGKMREASATTGLRSTAVSYFESHGQLI